MPKRRPCVPERVHLRARFTLYRRFHVKRSRARSAAQTSLLQHSISDGNKNVFIWTQWQIKSAERWKVLDLAEYRFGFPFDQREIDVSPQSRSGRRMQ